MTLGEIRAIVALCTFPEYTFVVNRDDRGSIYLRAHYDEADTTTGRRETQRTRRWLLSPHQTKSEIVQTTFKCVLASMEHRTREWFHYRQQPVFNPHFDVDIIHALCSHDLYAKRPRSIGGPHGRQGR